MPDPVIYLDVSAVRQGRLSEVRIAAQELASFVAANEPQLLGYEFYLDYARQQMTVLAIHPDAASLDFHLTVAAPAFRKFAELIDLLAINVYGPVSDDAIGKLQQKAQFLGGGTVTVHEKFAGFARYLSASSAPA